MEILRMSYSRHFPELRRKDFHCRLSTAGDKNDIPQTHHAIKKKGCLPRDSLDVDKRSRRDVLKIIIRKRGEAFDVRMTCRQRFSHISNKKKKTPSLSSYCVCCNGTNAFNSDLCCAVERNKRENMLSNKKWAFWLAAVGPNVASAAGAEGPNCRNPNRWNCIGKL